MSGFQVTSRPQKPNTTPNAIYSTSPSSAHHPAVSPILRNSRTSPDLRSAELEHRPPMIPSGSQVLVTLDIDAAYFVDLSGSTSPAAIKERIYAKLGIYDDDHANFRISRCRAGQPVGQPLDDWQLWDMCMRAAKESDPPMLIVLSTISNNNQPLSSPHHLHHPPPPLTPSAHHQQPAYHRHHSSHSSHNLNQSPSSPDSYSHLKHDYRSSSAGSRDSPDPSQHHLPSRCRWQRISREQLQHARDGSSSSSHPPLPPLVHTSSSVDIRNQSSASVYIPNHPSPVNSSFPDDHRPSPNSNTPFELPVYPNSHRPPRPQIETPDDWIRIQHPSRLSPETSSPTKSRPSRRPSDPAPKLVPSLSSSQPPLPSHTDPRLADYHRQLRSASSSNSKNAPATATTRRFPATSQPSNRRDLQTAKSMEELHAQHSSESRKRTTPGLTHPPLPNDSAFKIAASPASRAPPPLRIPRNDPSLQRPNQPARPSYPPQTSPSFPFPQPTINPHMRSSRPAGPPGYGSNAPTSSNGLPRIDPRNVLPNIGRPPPVTSSSLSARNPRVSLQIYENRYLDQARPPPRPRTGDGSSPMRPSQFSDRQLQGSLAPQAYFQQAPGYASIPLRPGELLQDVTGAGRRRERDQSREYRSELEREPAKRRPNMASPTIGQPSSSRFARIEDQPEGFLRSPLTGPLERSSRRPATENSRSRPFDNGSTKPFEPLSSTTSPASGHTIQDPYGGVESELIRQRANLDFDQEHSSEQLERSRNSNNPSSLSMSQANARLTGIGRPERRLANGSARNSDEMKLRDKSLGETSPEDLTVPLNQLTLDSIPIPSSTASDEAPITEPLKRLTRGRSSTSASASTGTFTSFTSSSFTNPSTTASVTTPPSMTKMFQDLDDDDDDDVVGTFVTPMQPYAETEEKPGSLIKPKLSLKTDTINPTGTMKSDFKVPRIEKESASEKPIENSVGSSSSTLKGQTLTNNGNLNVSSSADQRDSRRISFTGDDWAVRPPIDAVYENLEDFFPHHDLDKPIDIGVDPPDLNSPSSPATGGLSPAAVVPTMTPTAHSASSIARLKGRTRSIRVVAQEKKKLLRRTEDKARAASQKLGTADRLALRESGVEIDGRGAALLRRKSTKLWGAKIQEVVPGDQVSIPPINEATMGDDANNFSFKWVKGELIGKGSFGQVYLALNATNGEMLAVKQVELPKTRSDRECERQKSVVNALKSEIHLMRDLEHPNIVQYLGFEETTVYLSIFLEYVSGGSIGRCLRRHGAFELNVIKYFTSQILEGLKYLHGLHILHRDLKADNLLVDFSGNCKISDFGISKKSEHVYEDNTQMSLQGSIFWMAPEVVHNPTKKGYSAKVDIWSLGCVVLEMFAGRRPWSDEEAIQAMFKLGAERLRPPVPPDVKLGRMSDHFLAQCFIVDPEARPTADRLTDHRFLEIDNKAWRFEDSELYRSIRMPH
ncbi:hypothetical protein PGT21_037264 [Puccinia graminis f. sp. tritici]|nr:hypothetical protein PGT21_037264 [Puccinia graminis f. sp. tritici]